MKRPIWSAVSGAAPASPVALVVAVVAALAITACDRPPPQPRGRDPITVFATAFPLAQIAREVGGPDVRVDWLIELGKPLYDFTMTRRDRDRMAATDYTLCDSYRRTETWAAMDLAQRQNTGRVISADSLPMSSTEPPEGLLYLDPIVARQLAGVLAERFARDWPEHAANFRGRSDDFIKRLDTIVAQYPNSVFGDNKVLALAGTYAPLLARFGVDSEIVYGDVYRPGDADLEVLRKAADRVNGRAVLVPFDLPPATVALIEQRTGLKAFPLDFAGFASFTDHDTYLEILQFNLEKLKAAALFR